MIEENGPHYQLIETAGEKAPWLAMVHGFTANHQHFSEQIKEFQKDFRLILFDLRGHGGSSSMSGPFGVEEYSDDIEKVLIGLDLEKIHYWGTHTGSAIGLVLALRKPTLFASLILEGTFLPGFPMPRVGELLDRVKSIAQNKGVKAAQKDWYEYTDWMQYIRENPERCRGAEQMEIIQNFEGKPWLDNQTARELTDVSKSLSQIKQPALVYNGEADMPDFKKAALKLESDLPNSQRVEIENAGAFPGWENPKLVNKNVREFLQTVIGND